MIYFAINLALKEINALTFHMIHLKLLLLVVNLFFSAFPLSMYFVMPDMYFLTFVYDDIVYLFCIYGYGVWE